MMSLFVWALPFDLSGMGGPTSSYATAGIALRITESHKTPHHYKVETPSGENMWRLLFNLPAETEENFETFSGRLTRISN